MDFALSLISALGGYLFGSISFSRIVTHFVSSETKLQEIKIKDELTGEVYNRRPSSSTVSMALGWQMGCFVSALDILKVTLPVLALKLLLPGEPYFLVAAAFAVAGHNWPVFYRFRGGAGISAIYGGLVVVDPLAVVLPALAGLVIGLLIVRSFLVMFLLSLLLIIPYLWLRFPDPAYVYYAVAVNILYLIPTILDAKEYLRPGVKIMNERDVMAQMPMGRGMIKMMDKMKLPGLRKRPEAVQPERDAKLY